MVLLGLPEPPREPYEEDLSAGETVQNIIIVNTSSDSEDERDNAGYELLPMDGFDGIENEESDSENSNEEGAQEERKELVVECEEKLAGATLDEPGTSTDLKHIWSAPRAEQSIVMDDAHVNQVKAAMASFHLPASSIPPWAVEVSEDHWKDTLLDKLKNLHDQKASK